MVMGPDGLAQQLQPGDTLGGSRGGAFPTSPASGERYFRTDRGIAYFFDGTRWLSEQLYALAFAPTDFSLPIMGSKASGFRVGNPWGGLYDIYAVEFVPTRYMTSAASYTFNLVPSNSSGSTIVASITQANDAVSVWNSSRVAVGSVITRDYVEFDASVTANSGVANLYVMFQLTYRLVG